MRGEAAAARRFSTMSNCQLWINYSAHGMTGSGFPITVLYTYSLSAGLFDYTYLCVRYILALPSQLIDAISYRSSNFFKIFKLALLSMFSEEFRVSKHFLCVLIQKSTRTQNNCVLFCQFFMHKKKKK